MAIIKTFFAQPQTSFTDIFIIGAGAFGRRACERLSKKYPQASITVVDVSEDLLDALRRDINPDLKTLRGDGIEILSDSKLNPDTWIIPAIPVHVAREWLVKNLLNQNISVEPIPVTEGIHEILPNPLSINGRNDLLFVSIADFICPDNCPEPAEKCTHTGKPRPGNLYELIARAISCSWSGLVFRSFQLAPGIGGYPAVYLEEGLRTLLELTLTEKTGLPVIIATACRCHGVISAVKLHRP